MIRTSAERFDAFVSPEPNTGCHLWTGGVTSPGGYGKFTATVDGRHRTVTAHRYAWEQAHGPIPGNKVVRHLKCNQPSCVNVAHMALGTHAENSADMTSQKRQARGERQHLARLTASQVIRIRALWMESEKTQQEIADQFGIAQTSVSKVIKRETWKHI